MPHADSRARLTAIDGATVVVIAQRLIAAASPNPPGDTRAVAEVAAALLRLMIPGVELALHDRGQGVVNLVARVHGNGPGRRSRPSPHIVHSSR